MAIYKDALSKVSSIDENTFKSQQSTFIYDSTNHVIGKIYDGRDVSYVKYQNIPGDVKKSFISAEDKNFFSHKGVDIKANIRAFIALIKNKGGITQGASTITQQLARNVFLGQNRTWDRKLEEIFISVQIEKKLTKEQILEYYLNTIYFSNNIYGIKTASLKYFNENLSDLNLSEICFLAAIPNNPTVYDPIKNFNNTMKRRNYILGRMKADGYIGQDEYNDNIKYKIVLNISKSIQPTSVESYVVNSATEAFMKMDGFEFHGFIENENERKEYVNDYNEMYLQERKKLLRGGYKIYTSIDMNKVKSLQKSVDDVLKPFNYKENGILEPQGASVCIENDTGRVVAICGGRSQDLSNYSLNRAFQSYRQPGSSLKPLVVYTPALDKGYFPFSIRQDVKMADGPSNFDDYYQGNISLRYAVECSINTIPYYLLRDIGVYHGVNMLKEMNFAKICDGDYTLSTALGGVTYGVSPLEMAAGYSTIARGGDYIAPHCITRIADSDGNIVIKEDFTRKPIYSLESSYIMTDMLKGVMAKSWGTGHRLNLGIPCAGKTGTTTDEKDGWFCGYTAYYTTAVWVGYDKPKKMYNLYGSTYPGAVWYEFMSDIHKGLAVKDFSMPNTVKSIIVNKNTGKVQSNWNWNSSKEIYNLNFEDNLEYESYQPSNNTSTNTSNQDDKKKDTEKKDDSTGNTGNTNDNSGGNSASQNGDTGTSGTDDTTTNSNNTNPDNDTGNQINGHN